MGAERWKIQYTNNLREGLAIISDTTDNGNTSPYHYIFVLFSAVTPPISPTDSLNSALVRFQLAASAHSLSILAPTFLVSTLLYLLFFIHVFPSPHLLYCFLFSRFFLYQPHSLQLHLYITTASFSFPSSHPVPPCLYVPAGRVCEAAWSRGS